MCTIGPSTNTREMIWKLAAEGMNVARLNMSHGEHASHQKTIDLVREYNSQSKDNVIAIMLDTKVFLWHFFNYLITILQHLLLGAGFIIYLLCHIHGYLILTYILILRILRWSNVNHFSFCWWVIMLPLGSIVVFRFYCTVVSSL